MEKMEALLKRVRTYDLSSDTYSSVCLVWLLWTRDPSSFERMEGNRTHSIPLPLLCYILNSSN
jgi:hypothetical protein